MVMVDPTLLHHLDIVWSIVLNSEVREVYEPAINLLVYSHIVKYENTATLTEDQCANFLRAFLANCFDLIKPEANPSAHLVNRII